MSTYEAKLAGKRFNSRDEVWEAAQEAWNLIPAEQLMKLVEAMPRRLETVIKANGGPIKYTDMNEKTKSL